MDGDVFGRVTKLGAAVSDAVASALAGNVWDTFHARRYLDALLIAADGIPTVSVVVRVFQQLGSAPLLVSVCIEDAFRELRAASIGPGCTELDLMVRAVAESFLRAGSFDARTTLERCCERMLDHGVLSSRGGFMEQHGTAGLPQARQLLRPVAADAAGVLARRPTAKRLTLARATANVTPHGNLLGETP